MPARIFLSAARQSNFADGRAQIKEVIHADIVSFKPDFAILKLNSEPGTRALPISESGMNQLSNKAAGDFGWPGQK